MNSLDFLPQISGHLGVPVESIKFLRHSQNAVYEFPAANGEVRILRITAGSHRTAAEIRSELDWVHHLHGSGLPVCPPVPAADGQNLFSLSDGTDTCHCVVFERAKGGPVTKSDLTPALYFSHGRHLGRLHAAAINSPPQSLTGRRKWHDERYFSTDIGAFLPEEYRNPVRAVFASLRDQVCAHAPTVETFGPVHFDLGYSNFHLCGDELGIFDFDNCALGPFVGDIAAALYGSIFIGLRCEFAGDRAAFDHPRTSHHLEQVWKPFVDGYQSANSWQAGWNEQLEPWFQILYFRAVVHAWRLQSPVTHPNVKAALDADIENLLAGTLPLRFDFCNGKARASS